MRQILRRPVYLLVGLLVLVLLSVGSVKTHLVEVEVPRLDRIRWLQSLPGLFGNEVQKGIRKAIVLASYKDQDVSWLTELNSNLTSGWEVYRYVADASPTDHSHDNQYLTVQNPDGREALAYLTFIVDHYNDLPDYIVFTHGHDRAWHQPERTIDRLSALNLTAVRDEKYVSIQCQGGGCEYETMFFFNGTKPDDHRRGTKIKGFWDDMMRSRGFGELPDAIGRPCCAQFAVHRDAILTHDPKFWRNFRNPLLQSENPRYTKWSEEEMDGHKLGLYYEMVWHILFGKEAIHCPSDDYCDNVYFQGLIHCDRKVHGWADQEGWEKIKCTNGLRRAEDA